MMDMPNVISNLTRTQKQHLRWWIADLRSNDFKQATASLEINRESTTFNCCLGVACHTAINHKSKIKISIIKNSLHKNSFLFYNEDDARIGYPSSRFMLEYFGMPDTYVNVHDGLKARVPGSYTGQIGLSDLNDKFGFTFDEIADCIEFTYLPNDWKKTVAARQEAWDTWAKQ